MKLLFDFFPILLFFFAYKFLGIYVATAVAIAATIGQVALMWFRTRKFQTMHLVTLVMIVVFGGATLWLRDETFIKWKPTVINWIFCLGFLGSHLTPMPLIERLMGSTLTLPSLIWRRLNLLWVLFFFLLGAANLFVIYRFDTNTWVNFKLFGMFGLMLLFILLQAIYLSRFVSSEAEAKSED
ncbi:MAG: septation protein A [Methylococcales bacterium]